MSDLLTDLQSLEEQASTIALIADRSQRHELGYRLEHELRHFDQTYNVISNPFDTEHKIRVMAVLKILFDYILVDNIDDGWDTGSRLTLP